MKKLNKFNSNRAITLIALIITIIVMLILVMVSIRIAIQTGLFDSAGKATQDWDVAQDEEQKIAEGKVNVDNKTYNNIDEYVKDATIVREPKIGDYVNYEPEADEYKVTAEQSGHTETQIFRTQTGENALKWRIMSLGDEEGNILLVADRPTSDELTLYGDAAFENGPGIIDGLCASLYKNETLGATARSYNFNKQVLTAASYFDVFSDRDFGLREINDAFPFLIAQEFWMPVSFYSYSTLLDYICMCSWSNEGFTRYIDLGFESSPDTYKSDTLPVLPVVILPEVELIYDGTETGNWNIWNIQEK